MRSYLVSLKIPYTLAPEKHLGANTMRLLLLFATSFLLSSCANNVPLNFSTPSGKPGVILRDISIKDAKNKLIDKCILDGKQIEEQGTRSVVCWRQMQGGEGAWAQVLIGNAYSTPPLKKAQFVFSKQGKDILITCNRIWIETQMALGQVRQLDLTANHYLNSLQAFLRTISQSDEIKSRN